MLETIKMRLKGMRTSEDLLEHSHHSINVLFVYPKTSEGAFFFHCLKCHYWGAWGDSIG